MIGDFPVGIYLLKVNNRKTRTRCETCSSVSIVNFEQVIAGWVTTSMLKAPSRYM